MSIDKIQKQKDFFEIREQFSKIEKYVEMADVRNRFLEIDFWMDDLLCLARKYCEGRLAQRVNHYKKWYRNDRIMDTCYSLRCIFEREGWDPGILKKYGSYCRYEQTEK